METMRFSGEHTGGPAPLSTKDRQAFANALDRYLLIFARLQEKQPNARNETTISS
jgi:hypothetical protein